MLIAIADYFPLIR